MRLSPIVVRLLLIKRDLRNSLIFFQILFFPSNKCWGINTKLGMGAVVLLFYDNTNHFFGGMHILRLSGENSKQQRNKKALA